MGLHKSMDNALKNVNFYEINFSTCICSFSGLKMWGIYEILRLEGGEKYLVQGIVTAEDIYDFYTPTFSVDPTIKALEARVVYNFKTCLKAIESKSFMLSIL